MLCGFLRRLDILNHHALDVILFNGGMSKGCGNMKIIAKGLGLLFTLLLAGLVLIQIPAVQDRLFKHQVAKRMALFDSKAPLFQDDAMRVVICGSGAPLATKDRASACVMLIANGKYYLIDTGNRSNNNLGLWGILGSRTGAVFLTHFHSDHIGDLGEFNMNSWAQGRKDALQVYGPKGIRQVVEGFSQAYAQDSAYRTAHHGETYLDPAVSKMIVNETALQEGSSTVMESDDLKVTMFVVGHSPIEPAVGYRFDYKGRSVVISGDTILHENTIQLSQNADILIHDAIAKHMVKQMESAAKRQGNDRIGQILFDIQDYHASALDAAKIANQANVRKLVLTHLVPAPPNKIAEKIFMRGVSDIRQDSTMLAYDGLMLTLSLGSKDIQAANLFEY